ncbi:MAG: hypothetical protein ACO2Y5_07290 [Nitrosopumilaceae archaeon]|uniref:Uncharacterized protein n=1 Tax=Candidatus Nitrosomaritimum aestuariumsis TaxID=3342354 RepID=A0AC60W4T6_9ARCH|nr:hypothetical protein [Nitrosopumilaceae archaeon]
MPDESCRVCGGTLIDFSQCAECKKVISMMCKSCQNKTIEQFHSACLLVLNPPTLGKVKMLNSMTLA